MYIYVPCKKKNGNASTKGINPGQPAESVENDTVWNILMLVTFLYDKGSVYLTTQLIIQKKNVIFFYGPIIMRMIAGYDGRQMCVQPPFARA